MKRFFKGLLFALSFITIGELCNEATEGFSLHKITLQPSFDPRWTTTPSEEEVDSLNKLICQPYNYLSSGSECFTFLSQDEKTVLKCFKLQHLRYVYCRKAISFQEEADFGTLTQDSPLKKIPLPEHFEYFRRGLIDVRGFRLFRTFDSCKIAYEELKQETGILYFHYNQTKIFKKPLMIKDPLGIAHEIDLDKTVFVLQKRADLIYPRLMRLKQKGEHEKAKACINALFDLIVKRCQKGVADRDPLIVQNFGFYDDEAIEIDVGSFHKDPFIKNQRAIKKELFFETLELKDWLQTEYPELLDHFEEQIKRYMV